VPLRCAAYVEPPGNAKYRKYADAPEPMTQFDPRHHARIAR
jgi:hypothetical protein